jgi:hypothetical protein
MNNVCLIVQPIHPVGEALLRSAGFQPRLAARPDLSIVAL